MSYEFDMGNFLNNMMYYATEIFNNLIPVAAIISGIAFGIGLVLLVAKLVKGSLGSM